MEYISPCLKYRNQNNNKSIICNQSTMSSSSSSTATSNNNKPSTRLLQFFSTPRRAPTATIPKLVEYIRSNDWEKCRARLSKRNRWSEAREQVSIRVLSCKSRGLALHEAVQRRAPPDVVRALLAANGEAASHPERLFGWRPLHIACMQTPPCSDAIAALVDASPESAATPDRDGDLPLHLAAGAGADAKSISVLLGAYPAGASEADSFGDLPLHLACRGGEGAGAAARVLLEARPEAASWINSDGRTALHVACAAERSDSGGADAGVVVALLAAHPKAAMHQAVTIEEEGGGGGGPLPLHLAIRQGATPPVLDALLAVYPMAVHVKDDLGMNPGKILIEGATAHADGGKGARLVLDKWEGLLRNNSYTWNIPKKEGHAEADCVGTACIRIPRAGNPQGSTNDEQDNSEEEEVDEFNIPLSHMRRNSISTQAYYSRNRLGERVSRRGSISLRTTEVMI